MTKHQIDGALEALEAAKALQADHEATYMDIDHAVSYTHLTLPTKA